MHDEVMYTGSLFQVIRRKERFTVPIDDEEKHVDIEYELAKRPPGVRAIVMNSMDGTIGCLEARCLTHRSRLRFLTIKMARK